MRQFFGKEVALSIAPPRNFQPIPLALGVTSVSDGINLANKFWFKNYLASNGVFEEQLLARMNQKKSSSNVKPIFGIQEHCMVLGLGWRYGSLW